MTNKTPDMKATDEIIAMLEARQFILGERKFMRADDDDYFIQAMAQADENNYTLKQAKAIKSKYEQ